MLGQSSRGKDAEKGAAEDGDEGDQTDNYGLDHAGITQVLALRRWPISASQAPHSSGG